jgi:hypothetical protein
MWLGEVPVWTADGGGVVLFASGRAGHCQPDHDRGHRRQDLYLDSRCAHSHGASVEWMRLGVIRPKV